MPNKKDKATAPPEDKLLEERVDAMMDPKRPAGAPKQAAPISAAAPDESGLPPLDIFAGASGAPSVPKELVEDEAPKEESAPGKAEASGNAEVSPNDVPAEIQLDDAASDAAVDDIVAHEGDTVLAAEDATTKEQEAAIPKPKKLHHHPIFWTLVALIALIAIVAAVLLVSGGNWQLPGPLQSAKNVLTK